MFLRSKRNSNYVPILEAALIGLASGMSAVLLSYGVNWLGTLRVHLSEELPNLPVLPLFGLLGGLFAGLLVERVAPEASGSGIPQVKACLDRVLMKLDLRVALVKLLGGTVVLGSGFFLGREGPTVQLGAAMAAPLARLLPTTAEKRRQLIAAGAGAGLTAAFNAPLAGVVFVLEELLRETKASTIIITVVACSMACLVRNTLAPPQLRESLNSLAPEIGFVPIELPFYVLMALTAGLLGAVFNKAILGALKFNKEVLRVPVTIKVALAGLISGAIISVLPHSFHNYAAMRSFLIVGDTSWLILLVAFLEFYLLTLIAYGSGAPGGLFAPSLALGAALGHIFGSLSHLMLSEGLPASFALVGMGAFFSAVARAPLTSIVITFEMTSNFSLLTPLMISCVISSTVAEHIFKGSLYEHLMRFSNFHLQGPVAEHTVQELKAEDIMHKNIEVFSSSLLLHDVLSVMSNSSQKGFPVTEKGRLVGIVTQRDLNKLNQIDSPQNATVKEIMSNHPVSVSPFDSLEDILFLFSRHKFTWVPVTFHDRVLGIILESDVLSALFKSEAEGAEAEGKGHYGN